jgi:poly(3-hydroxyalkanoate) synthetase
LSRSSGVAIAITAGKLIFRHRLIELVQYDQATRR